MTHPTGIVGKF